MVPGESTAQNSALVLDVRAEVRVPEPGSGCVQRAVGEVDAGGLHQGCDLDAGDLLREARGTRQERGTGSHGQARPKPRGSCPTWLGSASSNGARFRRRRCSDSFPSTSHPERCSPSPARPTLSSTRWAGSPPRSPDTSASMSSGRRTLAEPTRTRPVSANEGRARTTTNPDDGIILVATGSYLGEGLTGPSSTHCSSRSHSRSRGASCSTSTESSSTTTWTAVPSGLR